MVLMCFLSSSSQTHVAPYLHFMIIVKLSHVAVILMIPTLVVFQARGGLVLNCFHTGLIEQQPSSWSVCCSFIPYTTCISMYINLYHNMDINMSTVHPIQCIHDLDTMYRFHGTSWTWKTPISHAMLCPRCIIFSIQWIKFKQETSTRDQKKTGLYYCTGHWTQGPWVHIQKWWLSTSHGFWGTFRGWPSPSCGEGTQAWAQANSCRNPQEAAGNCYRWPSVSLYKVKRKPLFLVIHKKPGFHFNWFTYFIPTKLEIVRTGKTYVAAQDQRGQVIRFHVSCHTFRPKNKLVIVRINLYILLRCVWWELFNISPRRTRQPSLEAPKSNHVSGEGPYFPWRVSWILRLASSFLGELEIAL